MTNIAPITEGEGFFPILARRPEILEAWQRLEAAAVGPGSTVASELKENVRRAIARDYGCRYCASFGAPDLEPAEADEALALRFAEAVLEDHRAVDAAMFDTMRAEFTDDQLIELCAWICLKIAGNTLGALLALDPASETERDSYRAWMAAQPAPADAASARAPGALSQKT